MKSSIKNVGDMIKAKFYYRIISPPISIYVTLRMTRDGVFYIYIFVITLIRLLDTSEHLYSEFIHSEYSLV